MQFPGVPLFRSYLLSCLLSLLCCAGIARAQSFAPAVNYTVGSSPQGLTLADFDRDGRLDVVTVNNGSASVSFLRGNGNGTFQTAINYATGPQPLAVTTGDFNHDGLLDLVVIDWTAVGGYQTFSALLGNGDGTFQPRISYGPGSATTSIATGDFNGDARDDLVMLNSNIGFVGVLISNGNGTFTSSGNYLGFSSTRDLVVRDFNQDGKVDVAVAMEGSAPKVGVFLGNGNGTLQDPVLYDARTDFIAQIAAGDMNGDGFVDLIATSSFSGGLISVLRGNGNGTFQSRVDTRGPGSDRLAVADVDGDGKLDVLPLRGRGTGILGFLSGNGDGTLRLPFKEYAVSSHGTAVQAADLNGDSKLDLIMTDQNVGLSIFINQTGPLSISGTITDGNGGGPLESVDVILTGSLPIRVITGANGAYTISGLMQGANYTVTPVKANYAFVPTQQIFNALNADQTANFVGTLLTYSISGTIRDIAQVGMAGVTVNLTGSASATVMTGSDGRYSFANVPGNGNYTVTPSLAQSVFAPPSQTFNNLSSNRTANFSIARATYTINTSVRDPNSNGYVYLPTVTLTGSANRTVIGTNNVFNGLPVGGNYTVTVSQTDAPFTNFILMPPQSQTFNNLASDQTATFNVRSLSFPSGEFAAGLAVGDFNGDSKIDMFLGTAQTSSVRLLTGNGDGTMQAGPSFSVGQFPSSPLAADFNRDGKLDIAISVGGTNVSVLLGNGNGTFQPGINNGGVSGPSGLAAADLNGDSKLDLLVANSALPTVSVFIGNGDGTFNPAVSYAVNHAAGYVTTGDLNGDGKLDVVAGTSVLLGDGMGGLGTATTFSVLMGPWDAAVADFDSDGKLDLAVSAGQFASSIAIYLGKGDGTFRPVVTYPTTYFNRSARASDFNGDGKVDLVFASNFSVTILMGNGDGTFQDYNMYFFGNLDPGVAAVADFNGDGLPDLGLSGPAPSVLLNQMQTGIQFSASSYTANEGDRAAHVTITRTGNTANSSSFNYATVDGPAGVSCSTTNGNAFARCDYATTLDTVTFAPGETQKTITIPLIDDAYAEGNESFQFTLASASGGVLSGKRTITINIADNDASTSVSPIFTTPFFVRQQYLDFLSREPEQSGFDAWAGVLNGCPDPNNVDPGSPSAGCDRIAVSSAFFGSQEFQLKGFFVFRFYTASLLRLPTYNEIIADMRSVTGQTAAEVFAKRAAFTENWVKRQDFAFFNSATDATFVNFLMNRYNLSQITTRDPNSPEVGPKIVLTRNDLTNQLTAGMLSRAQVLRALVESDEVTAADFNRAFVAMQYFGYLRRDPEAAGFNSWLNYLNAHPTDFRTMVNGFVNSTEYRLRFGNPAP